MKNCELCNGLARIYCDSDQANLCWECDLNVHSANFLVAKHSRSLLCSVCQSTTDWSASGAKIGRTVSVCERCANDEEDEDDNDVEEEEIDLEDIQVVPWSSTPPPQPEISLSSDTMREDDDDNGTSTSRREIGALSLTEARGGDELLNSHGNFSLKRMREDDDDSGTSTSLREVDTPPPAEARGGDEAAAIVDSFSARIRMPSKIQRTEEILTGRVGLKL